MKTLTQLNESYFSEGYRNELIEKLQNAFREEVNAWYGYVIMSKFLEGQCRCEIEKFFAETAKDEFEDHAMWILDRINQLNGVPSKCLTPETLSDVRHQYIMPEPMLSGPLNTLEAIRINIDNERGAIETYEELEKFTREVDPVTNKKIKEIWSDEEEHLAELEDFFADISSVQHTETPIIPTTPTTPTIPFEY